MKEYFIYSNPTKIYFGDGAHRNIEEALKLFGSKVLHIYGKSSIIKNGVYNDGVNAILKAGKEFVELSEVNS